MNAVRLFSLSYIALGINFLYIFYAQAIQKDKLANIIQIVEGLIFPLVSLILLFKAYGDFGIWISFFVSEIGVLIFIILYSRYIKRQSNGEYHGFFINRQQDNRNFIDFTINGNVEEAVGLSQEIKNYLGDDIVSTRARLTVEEILTNIIKVNETSGTIDVYLKNSDEEIILSIKDDGIEYNPVIEIESEDNELEFDNITVLNKIADNVDYARVLGLNNTVISIKK